MADILEVAQSLGALSGVIALARQLGVSRIISFWRYPESPYALTEISRGAGVEWDQFEEAYCPEGWSKEFRKYSITFQVFNESNDNVHIESFEVCHRRLLRVRSLNLSPRGRYQMWRAIRKGHFSPYIREFSDSLSAPLLRNLVIPAKGYARFEARFNCMPPLDTEWTLLVSEANVQKITEHQLNRFHDDPTFTTLQSPSLIPPESVRKMY